jgi:hypothetical protein
VHRVSGCTLPKALWRKLGRYGHYNSGNRRPRPYYLLRLCRRYKLLKQETKRHLDKRP